MIALQGYKFGPVGLVPHAEATSRRKTSVKIRRNKSPTRGGFLKNDASPSGLGHWFYKRLGS